MISFSYSKTATLVFSFLFLVSFSTANFNENAQITWGDHRAKVFENGQSLSLSLDQASGSGFQSRNQFLFGRFDMQLKLVAGNSAGSVTTFYLSSPKGVPGHDEIDFEFLGNSSGNPYTVHTNVYAQGTGNKEQQFHLWFDPTTSFHTYSIVWNARHITFLVDNIPIRVYHNNEASGTPFPKTQAMRVHASLWNADDWATQGGRVKADWTQAPFIATYRNFKPDACIVSSTTTDCVSKSTDPLNTEKWKTQELDGAGRNRLRWVQSKHMIYNYCTDVNRFPQGIPTECRRSRFL